jgi:hypothetical protein
VQVDILDRMVQRPKLASVWGCFPTVCAVHSSVPRMHFWQLPEIVAILRIRVPKGVSWGLRVDCVSSSIRRGLC